MPTREEVVANYLDAQKTQDEAKIKASSEALADTAVLVSPRGNVEGRDAIVERLRNPLLIDEYRKSNGADCRKIPQVVCGNDANAGAGHAHM